MICSQWQVPSSHGVADLIGKVHKATLKNNSVSGRAPGEFILRAYPAAFFFFFFFPFKKKYISVIFRPIFKLFSQFYAEWSVNYTGKNICPGGYFWSHPVDRKQTFF